MRRFASNRVAVYVALFWTPTLCGCGNANDHAGSQVAGGGSSATAASAGGTSARLSDTSEAGLGGRQSSSATSAGSNTGRVGAAGSSAMMPMVGGASAAGSGSFGGATSAASSLAAAGAAVVAPIDRSFIVQSPSGIVDKMDILFAVDNSLSMGDKQQVLATAVPQLLRRLTNPDCVDPTPGSMRLPVQTIDPSAACPSGMEREFAPIKDIHIGVVTSALGDFGGDTCPEDQVTSVAANDHAWLTGTLARTQGALPAFLSWSKADADTYVSAIQPRLDQFRDLVAAATELGCGHEMILESWYRFLIDPTPPTDVLNENQTTNRRGNVDEAILAQRKAFLRPDSLVTVIMLSDENDCSMRDDSYAWLATTHGNGNRMWRGSKPCATNPNDPCCFSCMLSASASEACRQLDPTCTFDAPDAHLTAVADDINMRCRSMRQRFGVDLLFPVTRYVNALTKLQICPEQTYGDLDCDCTAAKAQGVPCVAGNSIPNPLFQNLDSNYVPTGPMRIDASSVFFAGIVGVPWQDLAVESALADEVPLKYRMGSELNWDLFAPKDDTTLPLDPLMIEQTAPRTGIHPITGEAVAPPGASPMTNRINGHEWHTSDKDLQYACIFSLDQPIAEGQSTATRLCDPQQCGVDDGSDTYEICRYRLAGCGCTMTEEGREKGPFDPTVSLTPVCQASNGAYGAMQYYAKAYPGLRELQALRGFHAASPFSRNNAIVGSICSKDLDYTHAETSGYGYNPVMRALVDRLKDNVGGTCLPSPLVAEPETGKVPCALVEAISPQGAAEGSCACAAKQRDEVAPELQQSMRALLEARGSCSGADCSKFCFCQLRQLLPGTAAGDACLNNVVATKTTNPPGFCYVDPASGRGNPALVADCDPNEKRTIRIVGDDASGLAAPAKGPVFYTCNASPYEAARP